MKKVSLKHVIEKCFKHRNVTNNATISVVNDLSNICGSGSTPSLKQRLFGILEFLSIEVWEYYPDVPDNSFWDNYSRPNVFPDSIGMIEYLGNNPFDRRLDWLRGFQGVAKNTNLNHWVFTILGNIFSYHVSKELKGRYRWSKPGYIIGKKMDTELKNEGYNHFGDPDWSDFFQTPFLFVPVEHENKSKFSKVAIFKDNNNDRLQYEGSLDLIPGNIEDRNQKDAPWLAIHPKNGLLFTSRFNAIDKLRVYKFSSSSLSEISFYKYYTLFGKDDGPIEVRRIQGGCFSPNGHLFLLAEDGYLGSGIYGFDMRTGRLAAFIDAELHRGYGQEFEGITIWNLDQINNTSNIRGQIHAGLIDNVAAHGLDFYFKHWRVEYPSNL